MPEQRRRSRLETGERRTEVTGPVNWAPSELATIEAMATAHGQSVTAFIAEAALAVASGKMGVVGANGAQGLTAEQVTTLREVAQTQIDVRRLLASCANSLNQIAAAANSGSTPTPESLDAAVRYLMNQLRHHDKVTADLSNLIAPE